MPPASTLVLLSATATTVLVSIHHIFRLGPDLIIPAIVLVAIPLVLLRWFSATRSRLALGSIAFLNGMLFLWFGLIDGGLDHVQKALGIENLTILPGGDARIVETYFSLGSVDASAAFYEGTGVLQAAASVAMLVFTIILVVNSLKSRAAKKIETASSSAT